MYYEKSNKIQLTLDRTEFLIFFIVSAALLFQLVNFSMDIEAQGQERQQSVNSECIIRGGESNPPPPFVILLWLPNGECNSTIDYFVMFYDIKAVVSSKGEYIIFLET